MYNCIYTFILSGKLLHMRTNINMRQLKIYVNTHIQMHVYGNIDGNMYLHNIHAYISARQYTCTIKLFSQNIFIYFGMSFQIQITLIHMAFNLSMVGEISKILVHCKMVLSNSTCTIFLSQNVLCHKESRFNLVYQCSTCIFDLVYQCSNYTGSSYRPVLFS